MEFLTIYSKCKSLDIDKDIFSYYGVAKARIQTLNNMPTLSAYLTSGNYAAIGDDMSFYLDERFKAIPFDEGINPITVYANWKKQIKTR